MDLLITVIGNAVVHAGFREELLTGDPVKTAERWGFRLTKGDAELLTTIFTVDPNNTQYMPELKARMTGLEDQVYRKLPCNRPCNMSVPAPKGPQIKVA